ncbi:hypothetical protein V6N11_029853 [Hibiscus sabdariffa]|uniref:Uncharacterized protein n=2 Tax=Hibiscus sabdariffa TaxID=183260 RepID=A0ABR2PJ59_9ROSI
MCWEVDVRCSDTSHTKNLDTSPSLVAFSASVGESSFGALEKTTAPFTHHTNTTQFPNLFSSLLFITFCYPFKSTPDYAPLCLPFYVAFRLTFTFSGWDYPGFLLGCREIVGN